MMAAIHCLFKCQYVRKNTKVVVVRFAAKLPPDEQRRRRQDVKGRKREMAIKDHNKVSWTSEYNTGHSWSNRINIIASCISHQQRLILLLPSRLHWKSSRSPSWDLWTKSVLILEFWLNFAFGLKACVYRPIRHPANQFCAGVGKAFRQRQVAANISS